MRSCPEIFAKLMPAQAGVKGRTSRQRHSTFPRPQAASLTCGQGVLRKLRTPPLACP